MRVSKKSIKERGNKILLQTKDLFLVEDFLESLQQEFPEHTLLKCNKSEDFLEAVNTSNLFSSEDRIIALMKLESDSLEDIVASVSSDSGDIYVFVEQSAVSRKKIYTTFKSQCNTIKMGSLSEKDCISWVSRRMKQVGLNFDYKVPDVVVKKKGSDLYAISKEIEKLSLLFEGGSISCSMVEDVIVDSSEARYFDFSENFLHKRLEKTLSELRKINEYSYTGAIHFLIGQINRVYKIAIFKESGKSEEDISDLTGIPKFYIKTKYYTVLSKFNKIKLLKLVDLLHDLDIKIRSSSLPKRLLFESYILKAFKI